MNTLNGVSTLVSYRPQFSFIGENYELPSVRCSHLFLLG